MRILCIPYSHTFSHLARPLAVALELQRRGHEVHFAGESPKLVHASAAGFMVHALCEPEPERLFGNIRDGKLRFVATGELTRMIEADLELAGRIRPDVVLTDGRFSAGVSMQIGGYRHAAIVNVSSCEYRALPYIPFFEWIPRKLAPEGSALRTFTNTINLSLEMTVFDAAMPDFSRLSRKHALKKGMTATNCLTGADLTLLADIPQYFPTRNLPPDYQYVGPLGWELPQEAPSWWPPCLRPSPMVYVTMGTTGIPDFFQMLMELLEHEGMNAVITTGGQIQGLIPPSPFIHVEEFMDAERAIQASDAVICHGGNGSIYQALRHGRPIVGIPSIPDQKFNMRRVESLGAGLTVLPETFRREPLRLRDALNRVLQEVAFRASAGRLGDIVRSYNAAAVCADAIERLSGGCAREKAAESVRMS